MMSRDCSLASDLVKADFIPSQAAKTYLRLWQLEKGLNYVSEISQKNGHFPDMKDILSPPNLLILTTETLEKLAMMITNCIAVEPNFSVNLICSVSDPSFVCFFFANSELFNEFGKKLMNQELYKCYCGPP